MVVILLDETVYAVTRIGLKTIDVSIVNEVLKVWGIEKSTSVFPNIVSDVNTAVFLDVSSASIIEGQGVQA